MKEQGQNTASALITNFGVDVRYNDRMDNQSLVVSKTPVHANVDAPFRPLVPFVPEDYWDNVKAPRKRTLVEFAVSLLVIVKRVKKRRNERCGTIIRR